MKTMMTMASAAMLAMAAMNPAAAGGVLGGKSPSKTSEVVGPAAAGDPKPYFAVAPGDCDASACTFNFGKKGNKIRNITWINCGMSTSNGIVRVGAVLINDLGNQIGYFSAVSRAIDGTDETAVLEYKNPVTVAAGDRLILYVATSGTAEGGQCTLGGTIE